jgi:hypothetical protein
MAFQINYLFVLVMHILKEYSDGERSAFELGVVVGAADVVGFIYITDINIPWPIFSLSLPCGVAEFLTLDLYSVCL